MTKFKMVGDWKITWNTEYVDIVGYKVFYTKAPGSFATRVMQRTKTIDEAVRYIKRMEKVVKDLPDEIEPGVILVGQ